MSKLILTSVILFAVILATSCTQPEQRKNVSAATVAVTNSFSRFVPRDTANKMISSYLGSINYTVNDTDLRSLSINVAELRKYIDSMPTSNSIAGLKLFFAHTLSYTNSPDIKHFAGYNSGKLTLVIAAYDLNGNYVYYNGTSVLDYSSPCPPSCPPGNAGGALLTN